MAIFNKKNNDETSHTKDDVQEIFNYYKSARVNPNPPKGKNTKRAERKYIKKQRKSLRKDLKKIGIKKRSDFETIARELGYFLDDGKFAGFLAWLRLAWLGFLSNLGLKSLLLAAGALLVMLFIASTITEKAGSFTVNLTADMLKAGFVLSETKSFERELSRLFSEEIEEVNNITLEDIKTNVDSIDGSHNESNYIAYTFYIKNVGENTASYTYSVDMDSHTQGLGNAVWLMVFEDGKQVVYAMPSADNNPEELFGFNQPPFGEVAYDYKNQYYEENGKYGLKTTEFYSEDTVVMGVVDNVEVGEIHKYTIVIWVEGYDPECTNDIFGGYAKYSMNFQRALEDEKSSIFDGVFRKEYEDYIGEMGDAMAVNNPSPN